MSRYLAGQRILVGPSFSTVLPDMDFETYSDAGYTFDGQKFVGATRGNRGLSLVGAAAYAEHPSTEVLSLAYDLKDGVGERLWIPSSSAPHDLFDHIYQGGLLEAHNSAFEFFIWFYVCHLRMGWPALPLEQLRCSAAKSRAYGTPGKLESACDVLNTAEKKDTVGGGTMRKLSVPRKPTIKNPCLRWYPILNPDEFWTLYKYNLQDIRAEASLSRVLPDLQPQELDLWLLDQRINARGVAIDVLALGDCMAVFNLASDKYTSELSLLTGGDVSSASEIARIVLWLGAQGVRTSSLDEDHVDELLSRTDLPPKCRRVLEIRASLGAASVKKLFSIYHRLNADGRIRGLFTYCGADRTGRFSGRGPQPQNLPNSGPKVRTCDQVSGCGGQYAATVRACPHCGNSEQFSDIGGWGPESVESALQSFKNPHLPRVEKQWGDAVGAVAGCLRGLFVAEPGRDLICSDYSAIEGVVAAMLAGEQWRIDVFNGHGKIYEMGASKITGVPFEEMTAYKERTGEHHPSRKTIGKVSELASGFGGWVGAWLNFGAGDFMTEPEIKKAILAWRAASPSIVEMWGGQHRKHPWGWEFTPELYGLEGAAVSALCHPGQCFGYRGITYGYNASDDVLYCQLLSGRFICYHRARVTPKTAKNGMPEYELTYWGTGDKKSGKWVEMTTYGGKLFENVVQAVARDILTHAMINLEKAGYPIVLHVHDEVVAEVLAGQGSVTEFERIMGVMPSWAADWPIRAAGGWRGKRYRKD